MDSDFKKMSFELDELLNDICKFLCNERLEILPPKDRTTAESLISRSRRKLQELAKFKPVMQSNEEYVIMDRKVIEEEEGKNNMYSSLDDVKNNLVPTIIDEESTHTYNKLPAKDAARDTKYGYISMRRKFILGFEKMRRVYACIHNDWLLIYFTEKDLKPVCSFKLQNYEARETCERSNYFELNSVTGDSRAYHFMAPNRCEMLLWIMQINNCRNTLLENKLLNLIDSTPDENGYDAVKPEINDYCNGDCAEIIYEELKTEQQTSEDNMQNIPDISINKPPLPGRLVRKNLPIQVPPPVVRPLSFPKRTSDGSLVSYHEIEIELTEESNSNSTISFEDNNEEGTYEEFDDIKETTHQMKKNNESQEKEEVPSEEINKKTNVKPPDLPVKPKVKNKHMLWKKPRGLILIRN